MAGRQTGPALEMETRPRLGETVDLMRAHEIRDIRVQNPEGERLGDLTDIAIDRESGCIRYAVLAYGGILGFGEKHFAIPWEAVRSRPGETGAVGDTDKQRLDSASGFSRESMPAEGDWSLIRTPPPVRGGVVEPSRPVTERPPSAEMGAAAPKAEPMPPERDVPMPPPVQTVAGGWGGVPTTPRTEERPTRRETVVEEVRRERPAEAETRPVMGAERPITTPGPAPGHISASDLQTYLKGMDYPAGREDLVAHAQRNNAPESVITILQGFSNRTYRSAAEVSEEFGRETRGERPGAPETVTRGEPEVRKTVPHRERISASDLQTYLKGMDYPARKEDLIVHAQRNNAPESVIAAIRQFSDRTYQSAADVSEEFGKIA